MRVVLVCLALAAAACHRTPPEPAPHRTEPRGPELPADASLRLVTDPLSATPPDARLEVRHGAPNPLVDAGAALH